MAPIPNPLIGMLHLLDKEAAWPCELTETTIAQLYRDASSWMRRATVLAGDVAVRASTTQGPVTTGIDDQVLLITWLSQAAAMTGELLSQAGIGGQSYGGEALAAVLTAAYAFQVGQYRAQGAPCQPPGPYTLPDLDKALRQSAVWSRYSDPAETPHLLRVTDALARSDWTLMGVRQHSQPTEDGKVYEYRRPRPAGNTDYLLLIGSVDDPPGKPARLVLNNYKIEWGKLVHMMTHGRTVRDGL
jgi:hypothetical protein